MNGLILAKNRLNTLNLEATVAIDVAIDLVIALAINIVIDTVVDIIRAKNEQPKNRSNPPPP